jgi:hypothetical protein
MSSTSATTEPGVIPRPTVMDMVGHDSLESSQVYTQVEMQQKRLAQLELFKLFE